MCLTSRGLGITGQPCCMMGVRRGAGLEEEREREREKRCTGTNTLQMHCILAIVNTRDSACKCNYACCGGVIRCARAPLPWYHIIYPWLSSATLYRSPSSSLSDRRSLHVSTTSSLLAMLFRSGARVLSSSPRKVSALR